MRRLTSLAVMILAMVCLVPSANAQMCDGGCNWDDQTHFDGDVDIVIWFVPGAGNSGGFCDPDDCIWDPGCHFRGQIIVENTIGYSVELFDHTGAKQTHTGGGTQIPNGGTRTYDVSFDRGCGQPAANWAVKDLNGEWVSAQQFICAVCNHLPF
jgi:hypothetical protein